MRLFGLRQSDQVLEQMKIQREWLALGSKSQRTLNERGGEQLNREDEQKSLDLCPLLKPEKFPKHGHCSCKRSMQWTKQQPGNTKNEATNKDIYTRRGKMKVNEGK